MIRRDMDYDYKILERFKPCDIEGLRQERGFSRLRQILLDKGYDSEFLPDFARCLEKKQIYVPAIALYEGSLRIGNEEFRDTTYLHEKIHALYGYTLIHLSREEPDIDVRKLGVPINRFEFKYSKKGGLFLPDFDAQPSLKWYDDMSDDKHREDVLAWAHLELAKKPHNKKTCPYLLLVEA